jgi:pyruvate dehydrogenase E2 component (dihydrolipoamide acetyltransferase)
MHRALAALILAVAMLAAPGAAFAQSAGDEQYVDPFQGEENGGQAESPAQAEPAPAPEQPAAPAPAAEGGETPAETPAAEPAQTASATLPRTGAPLVMLAAAGYALLLAGIAIRRQT